METIIKVTIETNGELPKAFKEAITPILVGGTIDYQGVQFVSNPSDANAPLYAIIKGTRAALPTLFGTDGIPFRRVAITLTDLPSPLRSKPGWYFRGVAKHERLGVVVDPEGVRYNGVPTIRANGKSYKAVAHFLTEVYDWQPRTNQHPLGVVGHNPSKALEITRSRAGYFNKTL